MSRIILACALVGILSVPAKALDGTPSPANVMPTFKAAPLDLPPDLMAQANPGGTTQGVDPLIGTWKLNVEKSTFVGSLPPKSQILTWTGEGQNLINTVETVDDQGRTFKSVFRHIYDGMPHPTTGFPGFDSTAYIRAGNIISIARFNNGKQVLVGQAVIVPGKTYTLTNGGIDVNNRPYYAIAVYDRQ